MNRTRRLITTSVVGLALLASACASDGDDDGGTTDADDAAATSTSTDGAAAGDAAITIALGSEPTTLDPQLTDDGGERAVNDNIYETLVARTSEGDLVPGLATDLPTQVDDTTWEVSLHEGVTFHNGEAFDADSVVASVARVIDPEFNSEQLSFFSTITGAEAVDSTTVHVSTDGADPVLPARLYWMKMVPAEASGEEGFASAPVGTGPYRMVEWAQGEEITLEANSDYWGEAPAIDQVTYRFLPESSTRLSALSAGEVDLVTNLLPENIDQAPRSASVSGLEHPMMILHTNDGPTADVRVRRAINLAIDKQGIVDELFQGHGVVDDCQLLSPSWTGYNPDLEPYPYDPDQARELIAEAGAEGATIQLVGTSGRWLKDRETVEILGAQLSEVGLVPDIQIYEFNEYLNRLFDRETRPDAIYVASSNELLDADRTLSGEYHQDGIEASNTDAELANLVDAARTEADVEARQDLYEEATRIACDEAYFLFLFNTEDIYGMSERLVWEPRVDAKLLVQEMDLQG